VDALDQAVAQEVDQRDMPGDTRFDHCARSVLVWLTMVVRAVST
jgi:hypothetical protein